MGMELPGFQKKRRRVGEGANSWTELGTVLGIEERELSIGFGV